MSQSPRPLFSAARHRAQRDRMARLPASANFLAPRRSSPKRCSTGLQW